MLLFHLAYNREAQVCHIYNEFNNNTTRNQVPYEIVKILSNRNKVKES